jgi:peroxiredoxin Q/BCP
MSLKTGDIFPPFAMKDQTGNLFSSEGLLGHKPLVIYFYPKDETPGCTKQACSFRDSYQDFKETGAEVIGISSDSGESHENFARHHRLPFVLLSDENGEFRKKTGVPGSFLGLLPGRVTYIVDSKGIIKYIFNSQLNVEKHISEALRVLKQ